MDPRHGTFRNYRRIIGREHANALLALERPTDAAASVRSLLREQPGAHDLLGGSTLAACATAVRDSTSISGEQKSRLIIEYGDEAIALLRRSIDKGEAKPGSLDDDRFTALRERDDFQQLLRSLHF